MVCVCVLLVMGKFINLFNIDEIYRHPPQKYVISRIMWKLPWASELSTSLPLLPHVGLPPQVLSGTGLILILTWRLIWSLPSHNAPCFSATCLHPERGLPDSITEGS